jgi:ankyrin repeat protein/uncharacterized protein YihD (DUF1040 family)
MEFFEHKDLISVLNKMERSGGLAQRAVKEVRSLRSRIYDFVSGLDKTNPLETLNKTHNPEKRIGKCIKYDICNNNFRLVTVQDDNRCWIVFLGTHIDADRWLDKRGRNWTPIKDADGYISYLMKSDFNNKIKINQDYLDKPLLDKLDKGDSSDFVKVLSHYSPDHIIQIVRLNSKSYNLEEDIKRISNEIGSYDEDVGLFVYDVLALLASGDDSIEQARNRIKLYIKKDGVQELSELPESETIKMSTGDSFRRIGIGTDEYNKLIDDYYMKSSHYLEWMMFMHPEQEKYVDADYEGSFLLSGVSGSGKTCIAIKRAIRLASKKPKKPVLILTINKSLSSLIKSIVDYACVDDDIKKRIKTTSFFELSRDMLIEFNPDKKKHYTDITYDLGEHVDQIFREYYRCMHGNNEARVLFPLHKQLISRDKNPLDSEKYIREEFDWVRSALNFNDRKYYIRGYDKDGGGIVRKGRKYPLQSDQRKIILDGLIEWENHMLKNGVIDYLGLTTELNKLSHKIKPQYTHIIVDESQDFGVTELQIVRKLVDVGENDIFCCGDLVQHILPKYTDVKSANIQFNKGEIIKNYRNTKQILKAAYNVLTKNLDDGMQESAGDYELLSPKYANRLGNVPLILRAESLEDEIAYAIGLVNSDLERDVNYRACIVIAGYSLFEISSYSKKVGIKVLDGTKDIINAKIVLSDLEQTKGYEFDTVIIVNCNEGILPPQNSLIEEQYRYACQLYVSMTRAKKELYLSYSDKICSWLDKVVNSEDFCHEDWANLSDIKHEFKHGIPDKMPEFQETKELDNLLKLTGREFIYTSNAIGLSRESLDKIEEKIDGIGLISNGVISRWKNLLSLKNYIEKRHDNILLSRSFGTKTYEEIVRLLDGIAYVSDNTLSKMQVTKELGYNQKTESIKDDVLNIKLKMLDNISVRTMNCLEDSKIETIQDLISNTDKCLLKIKNFNNNCLVEIEKVLSSFGLVLKKANINSDIGIISPGNISKEELLEQDINIMKISQSIKDCLFRNGIKYIKDLVVMSENDLLKADKFNSDNLADIKMALSIFGLDLASKEPVIRASNIDLKEKFDLEHIFYDLNLYSDDYISSFLSKFSKSVDLKLRNKYMLKAARRGYTKALVELNRLGLNIGFKDYEGWTPLLLACLNGHEDASLKLIELGSNVNESNNEGWTPLICAANRGYLEIISMLNLKKAEIDKKDKKGWTALMHGARNGHVEAVSRLYELNSDININNKKGATPLMLASREGHIDTVVKIIELAKNKELVINAFDNNGNSALMYANSFDQTKIIEKLVELGANINQVNYKGHSALICASAFGYVKTVEKLIELGANVDHADDFGGTALSYATKKNHTDIMNIIKRQDTKKVNL